MLLPCVLTVVLLVGGAWVYRSTLQLGYFQRHGGEQLLTPAFARWARIKSGPWPKPLVFGDSLCGCQETRVPASVEKAAALKGRTMMFVADAAFPGTRPLQVYGVLPAVLAEHPTTVVVEINLLLVSGAMHQLKGFGYRQVSRGLPLSRIRSMLTVMAEEDVTPLDPILFRLFDATGALYLADGLRDRGQQTLEAWGFATNAALGLREARFLSIPPFDAARARTLFSPDPTLSPNIPVLRAIADDVRAAGARILFYVSPVNVELLDTLGVRAELDLPARMEALRHAIGAAPSEWLDLHALLPKEAFRDPLGHLLDPGCRAVGAEIATAILTPPAH